MTPDKGFMKPAAVAVSAAEAAEAPEGDDARGSQDLTISEIERLISNYRDACVTFATRTPGDPDGPWKAAAEINALNALLRAFDRARP